jgi:hypothetical protein
MDVGMWLTMVNLRTPTLVDFEIMSMKKFIVEYKRYATKCPAGLLRSIQQFLVDDQLEVIMGFHGMDEDSLEEVMAYSKVEFIDFMLAMHQATTSKK